MNAERQPDDGAYLREALGLARAAMDAGLGGPFGAVVVREGAVLGRGQNRVTSAHDPTAHAEIVAIRAACASLGRFDLRGATLYASCEPCPMCLGAILWARIGRVVFAGTREDAAEAGFDDLAFSREIIAPARILVSPAGAEERAEAQRIFALWMSKPDRVEY